jgi:hypothetical protein
MLTPQAVIKHFGSVKAVAEHFNIEPSAVYQWTHKKKVPRVRELELAMQMPEVFGEKK